MTHFLHDAVVGNLARQFEKIREGARRASPPISSAAKTLPKKLTGKAGSGNRGRVRPTVGHARARSSVLGVCAKLCLRGK